MNERTATLNHLYHIETWKLVALALVSLGLYLAVYIRRQSAIINSAAAADERIPDWIILLPQLMAAISLLSFLLHLSGGHGFEHVDNGAGLMFNISLVIWGFAARGSLHAITGAAENPKLRFDWLLTLFLSPFYFNYKINEMFAPVEIAA